MKPTRVVVLSEIRIYREGLATSLAREASIEVVGTARSGDEALTWIAEERPDVVLVDTATPGATELIGRVSACYSGVTVLAIGVPDDERSVLACIEAGAVAYVTCEASLRDLVGSVTRVARGEALCSPRMAGMLLRRLATLAAVQPTPAEAALTRREHEVIELIAEDLSNKEIARRLNIELSTVKNHVHNILEKLNVSRRSDAVARVRGGSLTGHKSAAEV
jgi:two-component system, NarL family, nitrate/nitrite response regulator NarL